jgi:hypothetical protein
VLGSKVRHPLGLPPHLVVDGEELALDLEAKPDLDTVLLARTDRQKLVEGRFAPWEATLANRASDPCQASFAWVPSRS